MNALTATGHTSMTSGGPCGCGGTFPCPPGQASGLERTRFFPRQLVTPDDLTQDQLYFNDKSLRHNRLLHGWGVVCGARVMKHSSDTCKVIVEAGYVLGPYGHEILIGQDVEVDLCHEGMDGNAVSGCGGIDPWCSSVRVGRPGGRPLYLAVKYDQCETRPVRAQGHGCGCNEAGCEYSRVRDGYAIRVLTELPSSYTDPMPQPDIDLAVSCAMTQEGTAIARPCPPCPPEPWVILADITLGDDGTVVDIDCFAHRRYVVSFADFYFLCRPRQRDVIGVRDVLIDRVAVAEAAAPARMLVALARSDGGTAYLPIHFAVQPGETLASLLEREGGREFSDPSTGETVRLRDLYAMAGADASTTLDSVADATALLEGARLRVADLEDARNRLGEFLDTAGLDRLRERHIGAPASVLDLSAATLRGVGATSTLGRKLAGTSIGEIAESDRNEFVERMVEGVAANRREALRRQAGETWDNAAAAARLARSWRRR